MKRAALPIERHWIVTELDALKRLNALNEVIAAETKNLGSGYPVTSGAPTR